MIIVRVELHSAITGKVSELARMRICNIGGSWRFRNYRGEVLRGRDSKSLDRQTVQREARIEHHPAPRKHVWCLVAKMLVALGYLEEKRT